MRGPLQVEGPIRLGPRDFGGIKPRQLLEILLAARGRAVPKERLAELLWGDTQPRDAAATLETYVSGLRRRLGAVTTAVRDFAPQVLLIDVAPALAGSAPSADQQG